MARPVRPGATCGISPAGMRLLSRISRLKAKTFAAYGGRVGAAAVQAGLVMDLRLASAQARL